MILELIQLRQLVPLGEYIIDLQLISQYFRLYVKGGGGEQQSVSTLGFSSTSQE